MDHFVLHSDSDDLRSDKSHSSRCAVDNVITILKTLCQAKVHQYQIISLVEHEILRLDVAVRHVLVHVHLVERGDYLTGPGASLLDGGDEFWLLFLISQVKHVLEVFAGQELHDQV